MLGHEGSNCPQCAMLRPCSCNGFTPPRTDARHLTHPARVAVEQLECLCSERFDDALCEYRADQRDETRSQIQLDVLKINRREHLCLIRAELRTMERICLPVPFENQALAGLCGR